MPHAPLVRLLTPFLLLSLSSACSKPRFPSLVGKSKQQVIEYCSTSTRRDPDNKITICVESNYLHCYMYFGTADEANKSTALIDSDTWWVDFHEFWYSPRQHFLEIRFQNGVVTSQKPSYISDGL